MQSFSAIIEAFGYADLSVLLGKPYGTLSSWKSRDMIPPEYWGAIVSEAQRRGIKGVSLEVLAGLAAKRRTCEVA